MSKKDKVAVLFVHRYDVYDPGRVVRLDRHIADKLCNTPGPVTHTGGEPYAKYNDPPERVTNAPMNRSVGLDNSSLTVPQLREELKSRGLPTNGRKAELIERLKE
ncbi:MAG: hypothetical protein KAU31_06905 [Spirochaetaceae bacterium]|nr:hypothetical protein [Spirochaetaceae bacterium]